MADINEKKGKVRSFGPPDWRYKCRQCKNVFTMPAPKGPSEEKNRRCPKCQSADIERTDILKSEACPPGG